MDRLGSELGGVDPLDVRLDDVRAEPGHRISRWRLDQRLALGLSPSSMRGLLLLLVGAGLGPHGVRLLSPRILQSLDPVVPVALAALGVLVGLAVRQGERTGRLVTAASVQAALTLIVVFVGMFVVTFAWTPAANLAPWTLALLLGVCAAPSSAVLSADASGPRALAMRVADLDDLLPIVVGGLVLAFMREGSLLASLSLALQACGAAILIALAGWLLITRAGSETEQRVFTLAALLLIGGAAEHLSLSALLCGLVAGLFWEFAGGPTRDWVRRDILHIQHPLLVLVLLIAGARVELSPILVGLGAGYVCLRTSGKAAGGWLARRLATPEAPRDLGLYLISPGIVGIAFALNAVRAAGSDVSPLLAIAVIGALGSELIALLVHPREGQE